MLLSLSLILIVAIIVGKIFKKLGLPSFIGFIISGVILMYMGMIDQSIVQISSELRQIALVVIIIRAGLSVNIKELKKASRPAILMSFLPALIEIVGVSILAPKLFGISFKEALLLGSVLAAVSPAIIVPRMIKLNEKKPSIAQIILAGASIDDIFVIVLFTSFLDLNKSGKISILSFGIIPVKIVIGILLGIAAGVLLTYMLKKMEIRDSEKVVLLLGASFMLVSLENYLPISGLVAIMSLFATITIKSAELSKRISDKFSKIWVFAEIILFVLVGVSLDIRYTFSAGINVVLLIIFALCFRSLGVLICLVKTKLNAKERLFCVFSYIPKATVQAAIGATALSNGLPCGSLILSVAVVSIIITAPIGAYIIDNAQDRLLK